MILPTFIAKREQGFALVTVLLILMVLALNPLLDTNCALLVDRLLGLRTTEAFIGSSAAGAEAPPFFGHRYTDADGKQWQELNLQDLSQHPSFLGIGA